MPTPLFRVNEGRVSSWRGMERLLGLQQASRPQTDAEMGSEQLFIQNSGFYFKHVLQTPTVSFLMCSVHFPL